MRFPMIAEAYRLAPALTGERVALKYEGTIPTQGELEDLFVNNRTLHRIETYLNRFNLIKTMRMEGMEIRHSAILAWLLDPRETHGLGDKFLRAFLCEAMRGQSALGGPNALEISQADLRDAEVRREWENIDIFVLLPRLNWAFVIENKYHSTQAVGQLATYARRVRSIFEPQEGALKVRGVFLTLHGEEPHDNCYAPIQYSAVCEILENLMETQAEMVGNDVSVFLRHYLEIIREAAGMSQERDDIEAMARQLYRSHKKVLDFVMNYSSTDFVLAMETVFGEGLDYRDKFAVGGQQFIFNSHNNARASFLPFGWVQALGDEAKWEGCENWWAGYPIICWFELYSSDSGASGHLRLHAEVGPLANHEFRSSLINRIKEAVEPKGSKLVSFQRGSADEGKKYSKFLKDNQAHINDTQDSEEIAKAMRLLLGRFQPVFSMVEEILLDFRKYGVFGVEE